MKYLLGGYYGMRNVGDDVLLYVALAEIARLDPHASFTVISDLAELTPPGVPVRIEPGGRRLENVRQMLRHDVWVFGGGGLLQDGSPRAVDYLQRLARAARVVKLLGRPIVLLGIGVGPLTTEAGRTAAGRLLRHADLVTVRDDESRRLARDLAPDVDVTVTADLAFLLPKHVPLTDGRPSDGPVLGISLLPHARSLGRDGADDDRAATNLAHALGEALQRHPQWRVTLFEFFANRSYGDAHVLRTVERELGDPARVTYRPYTGDFVALYAYMRTCRAFIGMRFHACLLAHAASVPCLMLAYHAKSESLALRLGLHADAVVPLPMLYEPQALASRFDDLLTDHAKFRPSRGLETLSLAAERNFSMLSACLMGARARRPQRKKA